MIIQVSLPPKIDFDEEEYIVCNGCLEEVRSVGPDGISVCENCGVVEGQTLCLTAKELEELEGQQ